MAEQGFLVCADITGYTQYLSESELDHASDILTDLLDLLLVETRAPLHLSRVEGDAVISYSQASRGADPQVVVDRLEMTYVAFRRALEQLVLNTTCRCNACANAAALDLKIVVHHGPFVVRRLGTQDELMGAEVNAMFRLVKNHVHETLGLPGYIAFTDAAVAALDLPGYTADLLAHAEEDAERGTVTLNVLDLGPVWEARRSERIMDVGDPLVEVSGIVTAPLERTWTHVTRPDTRSLLFGSDRTETAPLDDGRMGPEAVYVCFHGRHRTPHRIVEWDPPFRYVYASDIPGGLSALSEFRLEAVDDGSTRVRYRSGHPTGSKSGLLLMRALRPVARRALTSAAAKGLERLQALVAAEAADGDERPDG